MRGLVGVLIAASICFSGESQAQDNYQLFAGPLYVTSDDAANREYRASATVLSFPDSSVYDCSGYTSRKDNSFKVICNKSNYFNGTLLSGHAVTTQLNRGSDMNINLVWTGMGFWQLDQAGGNVQFCMLDTRISEVSSSCASTKIGN
jgi:hypothetical protein